MKKSLSEQVQELETELKRLAKYYDATQVLLSYVIKMQHRDTEAADALNRYDFLRAKSNTTYNGEV